MYYVTDICRIFYWASAESTLFSTDHETFYKIEHISGNKASLHKYNRVEITYGIPDHTEIKLETDSKRKWRQDFQKWKLDNTPFWKFLFYFWKGTH
jgi:hypothetical protein